MSIVSFSCLVMTVELSYQSRLGHSENQHTNIAPLNFVNMTSVVIQRTETCVVHRELFTLQYWSVYSSHFAGQRQKKKIEQNYFHNWIRFTINKLLLCAYNYEKQSSVLCKRTCCHVVIMTTMQGRNDGWPQYRQYSLTDNVFIAKW